jgi:hypothetical protein
MLRAENWQKAQKGQDEVHLLVHACMRSRRDGYEVRGVGALTPSSLAVILCLVYGFLGPPAFC